MKKMFWFLMVMLIFCSSCCLPPPNSNNSNWGRGRQVLPQFRIHTDDFSLGTGRNTYFRFHGKHGRYFSAYNLGNLLDSLIYGSGTGRMGGTRINIR